MNELSCLFLRCVNVSWPRWLDDTPSGMVRKIIPNELHIPSLSYPTIAACAPLRKCNDIYIPLRTWAQHYATPCPKLCTHTKAQPQHEQQKCRTLQYMHIMYTVYGVQYSMMYTGGIQGGLQHSHTTNGKCALAGPASHLHKQQLAI